MPEHPREHDSPSSPIAVASNGDLLLALPIFCLGGIIGLSAFVTIVAGSSSLARIAPTPVQPVVTVVALAIGVWLGFRLALTVVAASTKVGVLAAKGIPIRQWRSTYVA